MFFVLFLFWLHQYFPEYSCLHSIISEQATKLPNQVKVSSEEDDHKRSSFMFLRNFQSLSIYDCCSPVKKKHYVFPTHVVKIPESCFLPNAIIPTVSVSEGEVKHDKANEEDSKLSIRANTKYEDDKQNIRASAIPRPRAVISSPDNDEIIGNRNKMKAERARAVKNQSPVHNRHANAKCKTSPTHESAINTRKSKEASDTKSEAKVKKRSAAAASGQRAHRKEWET